MTINTESMNLNTDEPVIGLWIDGKYTLLLSGSIIDGGESIDRLVFREPLTRDIVAAGNPVSISITHTGEPDVKIDDAKMAAMIARLSGAFPSAIDQMRPSDYVKASWVLAPFFGLGA